MKSLIKIILLVLVISMTLTSCSNVLLSLYGIKSIKAVDEKTILKYGNRYNIPIKDSYEVDTAYFSFLFSLDTTNNRGQIKNHYQPLQALYYNHQGDLQSFHVNCYTSGFPNLKWNREGIFSTFLPKQQTPLDSIVPLITHLKYLVPLSQTEIISIKDYEYVIVVHWNRFMGRQSKRLIKIVQGNTKLSYEAKIKVIYANSDNIQFLANKKRR